MRKLVSLLLATALCSSLVASDYKEPNYVEAAKRLAAESGKDALDAEVLKQQMALLASLPTPESLSKVYNDPAVWGLFEQ